MYFGIGELLQKYYECMKHRLETLQHLVYKGFIVIYFIVILFIVIYEL